MATNHHDSHLTQPHVQISAKYRGLGEHNKEMSSVQTGECCSSYNWSTLVMIT